MLFIQQTTNPSWGMTVSHWKELLELVDARAALLSGAGLDSEPLKAGLDPTTSINEFYGRLARTRGVSYEWIYAHCGYRDQVPALASAN